MSLGNGKLLKNKIPPQKYIQGVAKTVTLTIN